MANIEKHAPGSFCWIELGTTDQEAAKAFYGSLFGWKANDFPMGPSEVYSIFQLEGRDAAAGFTLNAEMKAQGVPPHWMLYISVASADAAAAQAAELGGTVTAGPFDVMEVGRMAVISDPTGAMFSVWQPKSNAGIGIAGVPGTLCWADLSTGDPARASEFYSGLFGWEISAAENDPSGYLHIKNGADFIGGIQPASHRNPNAPPHWLLYFLVEDVSASAVKAKELGANWYVPPMTMEHVGDMSVLADPQGAVLALFKPGPRG
jgi:predicted enzyme related to lactoylglutathione lyase